MLLKHLNLLMRPDSGRIAIEGVDVTRLGNSGLDEVRKQFGMLFQAGALFDSMTVFDNVAFPLVENTNMEREEIAVKVREMLANVGLEGMENKYPSELSGGMQKRVGARARAHPQSQNPDARRADHRTGPDSHWIDSRADTPYPAALWPDGRDGQP